MATNRGSNLYRNFFTKKHMHLNVKVITFSLKEIVYPDIGDLPGEPRSILGRENM